jgi:hypothetical protein
MASDDWAPAACTLPTAERPLRLAEFDDFFSRVCSLSRPQLTRLDLAIPRDAEQTGRSLADRESACCSFFSFEFMSHAADVVMRIGVPPEYIDVLDAVEARVAAARGPAD